MAPFLPVARPDLSGNEERYVVEAIRSSWISSTGRFVERFEREFAEVCGGSAAIAAANGTVALHLALLALEAGPGDEVLVPSLTYVAVANSVRYVGAEPVFVDVDLATWCIDPTKLAAAIGPRTRGIIAVHSYGHPADMDAIADVARERNLWVIEDAAQAHLASYKGRPVGSLGTMATFSFYGNKVLTAGEGGAVLTRVPALEAAARVLKNQGVDPKRRYFHPIVGHNFRLTNVACALLCAQLERREAILVRRREIFARYRRALDGIPGVRFQPVAEWAEVSPWLYSITIDESSFGAHRDTVVERLAERGVETRPFFHPLHRLPPYEAAWRERNQALPETERLSGMGLNLPTYNALTDDDVDRVAEAVRAARAS
jgi:perosamine synthetase